MTETVGMPVLADACVGKTGAGHAVVIALDRVDPTGTKRHTLPAFITGILKTSPDSPLIVFVVTVLEFWFAELVLVA